MVAARVTAAEHAAWQDKAAAGLKARWGHAWLRTLLDELQALEVGLRPTDIRDQGLQELGSVGLTRMVVYDHTKSVLYEAQRGTTMFLFSPSVALQSPYQVLCGYRL